MRPEKRPDAIWRLELLGGLRVSVNDRVVASSLPRKVSQLLARLAIDKHRLYPRETLIEMLWPDEEPEVTRLRFRQLLATLRRDLNTEEAPVDELILADRNNVHLNPLLVATDVEAFEAAIRSAAGREDAQERIGFLQRAAEQYCGELLPGLYDDWVLQERQRLADAYVQALCRLAEALAEVGEIEPAVVWGRKAVAADPLREESYCLLMRLLAAAGRSGDGVRLYDVLKQRLWKELRVVPSERTRVQMEAIRAGVGSPAAAVAVAPPRPIAVAHDASAAASSGNSVAAERQTAFAASLPSALTRFFGRETEIADLVRALSPAADGEPGVGGAGANGARLITLVGPGGCGKTRLALETARRLLAPFDGAVWFVRLATAEDADQLINALAEALCPQRTAGACSPLDQVCAALGRHAALLVLDNLEQAAETAGQVVRSLLERSPGLRCLVTSRQRLNVEGEREVDVAPLPLPAETDSPEQALACPSLRLLLDRAQQVRANFALTPANAAALIALCRRLEGIPLAIELAAAWAASLTPNQILERLSERFELLVSRRKDLEERHRSLRATIAWSYEQLSATQQRLFAGLSVFQRGWTLPAAEAVCAPIDADDGTDAADSTPSLPLLDALEQLRERSLIIADYQGETVRFRMLQTLKEFAAVRLTEGEAQRLRARHAAYYLTLAEQAHMALVGPDQLTWLGALDAEQDNFRAALEWSLSKEGKVETGLLMFGALWRYWDVRCHLVEAEQWWSRLSAQAERASPAARARGLEGAGGLAVGQDQDETGIQRLEECAALYRAFGDERGAMRARCMQALALRDRGDKAAARPILEECLAYFESVNDIFNVGRALAALAVCHSWEDKTPDADAYLDRAAAIYRICGHVRGLAWCVHTEGYVARWQDNPVAARASFQKSLALYRMLDDRLWIMGSLWNLAQLERNAGDLECARTYGEETLGIARRIGFAMWEAGCLAFLGELATQRQEPEVARGRYREALILTEDHDLPGTRRAALMGLARIAASTGRLELALTLLGAVSNIDSALTSGLPWDPPRDLAAELELILDSAGASGNTDAHEAALARGRAMTCTQVIRAAHTDA
jgi:predicted ATPase/DNA-binding SARP family transcriptional activator